MNPNDLILKIAGCQILHQALRTEFDSGIENAINPLHVDWGTDIIMKEGC
jgi:hypothetical protein